MTKREQDIIRTAANMARVSSNNTGVQWAVALLDDLLSGEGEAKCPVCKDKDGDAFRAANPRSSECPYCGGAGTAEGMVVKTVAATRWSQITSLPLHRTKAYP